MEVILVMEVMLAILVMEGHMEKQEMETDMESGNGCGNGSDHYQINILCTLWFI